MAQKTRAQLQAENAALFVENTTGDITPTLEKTYNQDVNDSCMLLAEGTYTTISLVDWTALVAANGLVAGWQYLVTSAFVSTAFGQTWNILCVADSVNTVQPSGWVVIGEEYVPCSLASWLLAPPDNNVIFYNTSPTSMALTPDQVLTWSGLTSEGTPYCPIYILTTGGDLLATRLTDDQTQIRFDNVQKINSTAGEFGTYTPQTAPAAADDTFTPNSGEWTPTITQDFDATTCDVAVYEAVGGRVQFQVKGNVDNTSLTTNNEILITVPPKFPMSSGATLDCVGSITFVQNVSSAISQAFIEQSSGSIRVKILAGALTPLATFDFILTGSYKKA